MRAVRMVTAAAWILLPSCTVTGERANSSAPLPRSHHNDKSIASRDQHWLDETNIQATLDKEMAGLSNEESIWEHHRRLLAFQEHAQVLLKLGDNNEMELLKSRTGIRFPKGRCPISDL